MRPKGGSGNNTGLPSASGEVSLGLHSSLFLPKPHSAFSSRKVLDKENTHFRDTNRRPVLSTHFKFFHCQWHRGEALSVWRGWNLGSCVFAEFCLSEATLGLSISLYICRSVKSPVFELIEVHLNFPIDTVV